MQRSHVDSESENLKNKKLKYAEENLNATVVNENSIIPFRTENLQPKWI